MAHHRPLDAGQPDPEYERDVVARQVLVDVFERAHDLAQAGGERADR